MTRKTSKINDVMDSLIDSTGRMLSLLRDPRAWGTGFCFAAVLIAADVFTSIDLNGTWVKEFFAVLMLQSLGICCWLIHSLYADLRGHSKK